MAGTTTSRMRALSGGLDQAFSSASNGLIIFAIAVVTSAQQFGRITILMTALVAVLGCLRGALGTPLLLKSNQTSDQIRREGGYALTAALLVSPLVAAGLVALGTRDLAAALCLAVATPAVLTQDVQRYVLIAEGRAHIAAIWDGLWCAGTVTLLVLTWLRFEFVTAPVLLGGWALFAYLSLAGMLASTRIAPRIRGLRGWAGAGGAHRVRYGIDAGLEQLTAFAVLALIATLLSPAVTAALRGATALLAPIAMFGTAIQVVVISESTRSEAGPRQVWDGLRKIAVATAFITALGSAVLYLLPDRVGALLLGASWSPAKQILPLITLEYAAAAFALSLAIYLRTFNRSADTVRLKFAMAAATVIGATLSAVLFRSATGVAVGLAVATILVTTVALAIVAPWQPRARTGSVDIAAPVDEVLPDPALPVLAHEAGPSSTDATVDRRFWPHCRVQVAGAAQRIPTFLSYRPDDPEAARSGLIGAWVFGVMAVLGPITIMLLSPPPQNSLWLGPAIIIVISAARFAWITTTGERRLSEMMFWSFTYAFMGLAPLAQLLRDFWPDTVPRTDTTVVTSAVAVVLVGLAAFLLGVAIDRLTAASGRNRAAASPSAAAFTVDYTRLMWLVAGATVLTLFYLSQVGVVQFLKTREEAYQALSASLFAGSFGVVFRAAVFMSLLVAWVGLVRWRREARLAADNGIEQPPGRFRLNMWLIVILGALLANCLNPVSNARYLSGTAILAAGAAMGMFATTRRFRISTCGFLIGLLILFPQADAFRYSREAALKGGPMEALLSPDYDSFAQVINAVTIAARDGINVGHQALGVMLFWVPRAIWPEKAVDTGIYIANARGYPFTNLSAPLWTEFYLNAGWFGLILGMLLLGYFLHRWDTKLNHDLAMFSMPSILGSIVPFYMLILLRGSLLQAAPYLFFTVVSAMFIARRHRETPAPAALPKYRPTRKEHARA